MIKVYCRTNLDLSYEKWPNSFPAIPTKGDLIQSMTDHSGFRLELEVFHIVWKTSINAAYDQIPIPTIELHIPKVHQWSIKDFYEWYAPLVGRSVSAFI